jgi:TonB family protein
MPVLMRTLSRIALALLLLSPMLSAENNKMAEALALITKATELSDIESADSPPLQLKVHFRALHLAQGDLEGAYTLLWQTPRTTRTEISLGPVHMMEVTEKDRAWMLRNLDFAPQQFTWMRELLAAIMKPKLSPGDTVIRIKSRKSRGGLCQCVELESEVHAQRELCFADSGELVSLASGTKQFEFSEFDKFGSKQFPRVLRVSYRGQQTIEARLDELLQPAKLDPADFQPPAGAVERMVCDNPTGGKLVRQVVPRYPTFAIMAHRQGITVLYALIGKDGSVNNLHVIESAGQTLDQSAIAAVRQWVYSPYMCKGSPIEVEREISVSFAFR